MRNGKVRGLQRYRGKGCGCNFTATRRRGKPAAMKALAKLMYAMGNVSFCSIARLLNVSDVAVLKRVREEACQLPEPAVAGNTSAAITGVTLSTSAITASGIGTYAVTASGGVDPNYAIAYGANGTMTVIPEPLTVGANNTSRVYGGANPTLTATYTGLVNGDPTSVVTGLTFTSSDTSLSPSRQYQITPANGMAQNYNLTYAPGTLTITGAAPIQPNNPTPIPDVPNLDGPITPIQILATMPGMDTTLLGSVVNDQIMDPTVTRAAVFLRPITEANITADSGGQLICLKTNTDPRHTRSNPEQRDDEDECAAPLTISGF